MNLEQPTVAVDTTGRLEEFLRNVPPLAQREIHFWRAPLVVDAELPHAWMHLLSADECVRAMRFRFDRDRRSFVASHGFLRMLLAAYTGVPAEILKFETSPLGKPSLSGANGGGEITFNMAHTDGVVVYAIARGARIGVDAEVRNPDLVSGEKRVLCPRELSLLSRRSEPDRTRLFFTWWTRKEALVKALGSGLSYPVWELDVAGEAEAEPGFRLPMRVSAGGTLWSLFDAEPSARHAGAIAAEGEGWSVRELDMDGAYS